MRGMDPKLTFLCHLGAALCFLIAAVGGTRRGAPGQPAVLIPAGLLLWLFPTLWASWTAAF